MRVNTELGCQGKWTFIACAISDICLETLRQSTKDVREDSPWRSILCTVHFLLCAYVLMSWVLLYLTPCYCLSGPWLTLEGEGNMFDTSLAHWHGVTHQSYLNSSTYICSVLRLTFNLSFGYNLIFVTYRKLKRGGRIGSWWGNRRGRDRWGDLGVDGWIIIGWISRRWVVGMWTGLG